MTSRLSLNEDVFFCIAEGQGIFLDLRRDTYNAIPIAYSAGADGDVSEEDVFLAFDLHKRELLEEGLLTEQDHGSHNVSACRSITRPSSHLFFPDDQRAFGLTGGAGKRVRIGPVDLADFFLASRRASWLLKSHHIHEVVQSVRSRKGDASVPVTNLDDVRRHTAIYRKLRPWYPRGYLCIYDGLALVEFLARRRIFPTWVFGVQAQPFGAHCWAQTGDHLLNETLEYADQFTPIMAV